MNVSDPANPAPRSYAGDLLYAARYYLGSRIGLVAVAASALSIGAYYNWAWLVAAGIAPILLMMLPCAAMCAFGLCKRGDSKGSTGAAEGSDGEQTPKLAASPGESQPGTSDQPTRSTSGSRTGCC